MWLIDDSLEMPSTPDSSTKNGSSSRQGLSHIERKREQSRASTRRWRANEKLTLDGLRRQILGLETELKSKLAIAAPDKDRRMESLIAKKRFYMAQNIQLLEAIKLREMNLGRVSNLMERNIQASLFDDAFLLYMTRQTQDKLTSLNLRQGPEHVFNGIHCIALTSGQTMCYDLWKEYVGMDHCVMGDLAWVTYQDKSKFLSLDSRVVDHQLIRTVNANMLVITIKVWDSDTKQIVQRYLVLHRDRNHIQNLVTATVLNASLAPAPHAFFSESIKTSETSFVGSARGMISLKTGSPEEANAVVQAMLFAQCRFETYAKSGFLALPSTATAEQ
ncbi:Aste57867_12188 [Aphanomyces stellatus]|uniref:Aste57867_12188 protein n=1 Tax=Aphanomyces stellatus TaxID=120398 RepID=A0A485KWA4_9STRA|nr:hypothetical protein As57867_012143 [Aphanomyces stellatus]VFT89042.1 Aste57867_12188 [Aphanomyces stellatus]